MIAPAVTVTDWTPLAAGDRRGLVDVHLPSGLILHPCTMFAGARRTWAVPPAKLAIGRDGGVQRAPDGQVSFEPMVGFGSQAIQDRWSDTVIEAVRAMFPEALA